MECTEDASKCAIPMENPLIGISDFGSQLIEVSVTIIVAAIAIDYFGSKVSQKFLGDDGFGPWAFPNNTTAKKITVLNSFLILLVF